MRIILSLTFVALVSLCDAQILVSGMIVDEEGNGIPGAWIIQAKSRKGHFSDFHGGFHIVAESILPDTVYISKKGFYDKTLTDLETIQSPLTVVLEKDPSNISPQLKPYYKPDQNRVSEIEPTLSFVGDISKFDFSEFRSIVGDYSMNLLQNVSGTIGLEFGITWDSHYIGASYGFNHAVDLEYDSLNIRLHTTKYGLHVGHHILNSDKFRITPRFTLMWNRFRLIHNATSHRIPIEQYLEYRDLDIRFNLITGIVGIRAAFNMDSENFLYSNRVEFGAYVGYHFGFQFRPWVYSSRNRLLSDQKLGIMNLSGGMHVTLLY